MKLIRGHSGSVDIDGAGGAVVKALMSKGKTFTCVVDWVDGKVLA